MAKFDRKQGPFIVLAWALLAVLVGVIIFLSAPGGDSPRVESQSHPVAEGADSTVRDQAAIESPLPSVQPDTGKYRIYIVIDDTGHNLPTLDPFLAFPGKLTFAVLPGLSHSADAARLVREHGEGLILHQPMEAVGGDDPGPGLVRTDMAGEQIRNTVENNLAEIGPVDGMNNHMGSKGTQDPALLEAVMRVLKEKQLFFLDSRTTAQSKAAVVAGEMGVSFVQRDIFLDNDESKDAIQKSLEGGLALAKKRGYAVMIGHAWSTGLAQILVDTYPDLLAQGYEFDSLANFFLGAQAKPAQLPTPGTDAGGTARQ